jgi:hypothetical protein
MAEEITLRPGWLIEDVRRASQRLDEWATPRTDRFDEPRSPATGVADLGSSHEIQEVGLRCEGQERDSSRG